MKKKFTKSSVVRNPISVALISVAHKIVDEYERGHRSSDVSIFDLHNILLRVATAIEEKEVK